MISYKKAISLINKISVNLPIEEISISEALNRVNAKDIFSPSELPSSNNSAFDGYALLSKETKKLNKKKNKKFEILKIIAAGDNPKLNNYKKNSTVEIMTGAIIPKQFDTIIPVEKVKYFPSKFKSTHIIVEQELKRFSYIRFKGEDYKSKDLVIKKNKVIKSNHLMALAALGINKLFVKKIPKIIFFGTGNELLKFDTKKIPKWKIRNSNSLYISSFGKDLKLEIIDGGIVKDNEPNKLKKKLKKIIKSDIDFFITSGAVSAGKYDFIPNFVKTFGFKEIFKGVQIKPGRPLMISKLNEKIFFGLPGNPISLAVGFRFFVYPLIRNILGIKKEKKFKAKLLNTYIKQKNFNHFLRCTMDVNEKGVCQIKILPNQQSNKLKSFTESNCWGIFPEGKDKFKQGDFIEWLPLIPGS